MKADLLLDNPIIVKHVRSRLRRRTVVPAVAIVSLLCLCILWLEQAGYVRMGTPISMILGLQAIVLIFIGANQIGATMLKARETGIIDFHRVSPLPSVWLMLGFFFGPPVLEYLLAAIAVPFGMWFSFNTITGVFGYFQLLLALLLIAWVVHALVLVSSLTSKRMKGSPRGTATMIVLLALFLGRPVTQGILYASSSLQDAPTVPFFGVPIYWLAFFGLYACVGLGMLLVAATRKLRSERLHAYTKPFAVFCLAAVAVLTLGALWHIHEAAVPIVVIYLLTFMAILLTVTITPERAEYVKGLRRAKQHGWPRPSPWSDAGVIRLPLFILCGLVFLASMISLHTSVLDPQRASKASLAIALGVFVVAYFGLALQFFCLRMPKAVMGVMCFFLFVAWLVPLLMGSVLAASNPNPQVFQPVLAVSPIAGIAMASGLMDVRFPDSVPIAALTPAIGFAVIFNILVVASRRKIDLLHRDT